MVKLKEEIKIKKTLEWVVSKICMKNILKPFLFTNNTIYKI
jgi:hypothetical protein